MQITQEINTKSRIRPASAISYMKDYRIPKQQVYNDVRNNVLHTFNRRKSLSKESKHIKQLIEPYQISKENSKKIDKLLIKYSLNLDFSKRKLSNKDDEVDVQFIVKRYIKSCSKAKQKQQASKRLKIDVNKYYSKTSEDIIYDQFFPLQSKQLKQLQDRDKKRNGYRKSQIQRYKHPYMNIYNNTQRQTVKLLNSGKAPQIDSDLVSLPQPQQWEKNHKKFRSVYSGIKTMRMIHSSKKQEKNQKQFFIS